MSSCAHSANISADTCGVSMPIWSTASNACRGRRVDMGVGEPVGEIVSALRHHRERFETGSGSPPTRRRRRGLQSSPPPAPVRVRRRPHRGCPAARPRRCRRPPDHRSRRPTASWPVLARAPWRPRARPPESRNHPPEVQGRDHTPAQRTADLRSPAGPRTVIHVALDNLPARGGRPHQSSSGYPDLRSSTPRRKQRVSVHHPHRRDVMHGQAMLATQPPAHRSGPGARMPRPASVP